MIADLCTSLAVYAVVFIAFCGWGGLLLRGVGVTGVSVFMTAWAGFAFVLLLLQVVHLFAPIDLRISFLVYGGGGVACLFMNCAQVGSWRLNRLDIWRFALILTFAAWVALRAMNPHHFYDTGLYHLNAVKWLNSYAIVPGLGNLHGRLGFNQSIFTYAASLNFYPYLNHAINLVNSSLVILLFAECMWRYSEFFQKQMRDDVWDYIRVAPFVAGLAFVFFLVSQAKQLSSMSPDFAVSILQIVITIYFLDVVADYFRGVDNSARIKLLLLLAASTTTVKLSAIVHAGMLTTVCFWFYRRQGSSRSDRNLRSYLPVLLACAVILLVWIGRGYLTSGYPFYPSSIGRIPTEWSVPVSQAEKDRFIVTGWARYPTPGFEKVFADWQWLDYWLKKLVERHFTWIIIIPFITGAIFVSLALYYLLREGGDLGRREMRLLALPLPALGGMVFWFLLAPDPRFAQAIFWGFSLSSAMMLIWLHVDGPRRMLSWRAVAMILIAVTLPFFTDAVRCREYWTVLSTAGYPANRNVPLVSHQASSSLIVLTPAEGDQCWDSPLPCAPTFNHDLRLLDGRSIAGGFASRTAQNYGLWWQ